MAWDPRVYIHVRSKEQVAKSKVISQRLRGAGYKVPETEILVDKGPTMREVRFFHKGEQEEAKKIVQILGQAGVAAVEPKYITGNEHSPLVKPHQFEVWFSVNVSSS
jgi:hypothetical protein